MYALPDIYDASLLTEGIKNDFKIWNDIAICSPNTMWNFHEERKK